MSININSEASCRKAYLNYHCYGNTMQITPEEMGEITREWSHRIHSWQTTVSSDVNEYDFDDSEYASYKEKGKKEAQEQTGYDGSGKGKMKGRAIGDAAFAVGTTVASTVAAKALGKGVLSGVAKISKKAGKKMAGAAMQGKGNAFKKVGLWAAAVMEAATAAIYYAKKPNKNEKAACDEMQNVLGNAQASLDDTQADMEEMSEQIIELSDQATEVNEEANDEIKDQKTKYDIYKSSHEALKAKIAGGESLTESEKSLWQNLVKGMSESGENMTTIQEDTTESVGELDDEIGTYQEGYDYAAETMAEIEGQTDYAASFDSATRTMCYVEGAAQSLNAADAAITATQLFSSGFWNYAFAAIAAGAGVSSGIAAREQFTWAGDVGTEIDIRKDTQTMNTETMDIYTEEIDAYDGIMQGVEELNIDMPDDVEPPKDTELPPTTGDGLPEGTPDPIKPDVPEKKKPEA